MLMGPFTMESGKMTRNMAKVNITGSNQTQLGSLIKVIGQREKDMERAKSSIGTVIF
jgi:hypothetical protein